MKRSRSTLPWAKVSAEIEASQEMVWKVLTQPELTEKYMYQCQLHAEWHPGGSAVWKAKSEAGFWQEHVKAKVLVYLPHTHLAFTIFHKSKKNYSAAISELHFYLESAPKGTQLRIEQGDFSTMEKGAELQKTCQQGWESVLPDLIKTCNTAH